MDILPVFGGKGNVSIQISYVFCLLWKSTSSSSVTQGECPLPNVTLTGALWYHRDLCPTVKQLFWELANRSGGLTKSVNRRTSQHPQIPTTPAFSFTFSRSHGTLPCMKGQERWHMCEHMVLPSWGKCTWKHMVLPSSSSANTGRPLPWLHCLFFHMVEIVHENG